LSHDAANGGSPSYVLPRARIPLDEPVDFLQVAFAAKLFQGDGYNLRPRRKSIRILSRRLNPDGFNRNGAE
jgi:hypothetical protein